MSHTYSNLLIHSIFSTANRKKLIRKAFEERLWLYICGIAKNNNFKVLSIGGIEDHIHLLLSLKTTISISKAIQLIKGKSSSWLNKTFPYDKNFKWQEGYGAFSISFSEIDIVIDYIKQQKEHHKHLTFEEEFKTFLKRNNIKYDSRYILD